MTADTTRPAPDPQRHLQRALMAVAVIELLNALLGLRHIFNTAPNELTSIQFAQALLSLYLALAPLVVGTALWLAIKRRLRQAIIALGTLTLLSWALDDVWSVAIHGPELSWSYAGQVMFVHHFVNPAAATVGVALAVKDRQLPLAGLLVCFPTLYNWINFFIFAGAVFIRGF